MIGSTAEICISEPRDPRLPAEQQSGYPVRRKAVHRECLEHLPSRKAGNSGGYMPYSVFRSKLAAGLQLLTTSIFMNGVYDVVKWILCKLLFR